MGIDVLMAWLAVRGLPRLRRASAPVLEYLGIACPSGSPNVFYLQSAILLTRPDVQWHDAALVRWDRLLVPAFDVPNSPWLGEWLALAYLTYVPLLAGGTAVLYASGARGTRPAAERAVRTMCIGLAACYLPFISYPVLGPRFLNPELQAIRMGSGPFVALARWNQDHAMLRGASFPSAHVAAILVVMWGLLHVRPRLFLCLTPLAISLAAGAVYLAYHYVSDVVAGALVALAAIALDAVLWRDARSSV